MALEKYSFFSINIICKGLYFVKKENLHGEGLYQQGYPINCRMTWIIISSLTLITLPEWI